MLLHYNRSLLSFVPIVLFVHVDCTGSSVCSFTQLGNTNNSVLVYHNYFSCSVLGLLHRRLDHGSIFFLWSMQENICCCFEVVFFRSYF